MSKVANNAPELRDPDDGSFLAPRGCWASYRSTSRHPMLQNAPLDQIAMEVDRK